MNLKFMHVDAIFISNPVLPCIYILQMTSQTNLSLEEFEQEDYDFEDLERIASDDNKIEFLKVLSTSQQLIEWLQRETNGTNLSLYMYVHI